MVVKAIAEYGNNLAIIFSSGTKIICYPTVSDYFMPKADDLGIKFIRKLGNILSVKFSDESEILAYPTQGGAWIINASVEEVEITTWQWPLDNTVWNLGSGFGGRINPYSGKYKFHWGIDINGGGIGGTPIKPAFDGKVITRGLNGSTGFGNYVIIKHPKGERTLYAHMRNSPSVALNQTVDTSTTLGLVGSTGYSTGDHLHFETRPNANGVSVNPITFMSARGLTW